MEKNYEKSLINKTETTVFQNEFETEYKQIHQLLENEQRTNPEYQECLEKLKQEFGRRVDKANLLIQNLSEEMKNIEWFIAPPVMSRTDYGYNADIDLVVVHDSEVQVPKYDNEIDGVFIMPTFITRGEITKLEHKYPEIREWYQNKLEGKKFEGKSENQPIDVLSLEDKLRYSISPEKREQLRNYRLVLANHFMKIVNKKIDTVSWDISGSTVADIDKFSVCSDLDLEILVNPETPEQESEIFFYLHHYLKHKFAEDYETKMCFTETTLDFVKRIATLDPKMKDFFEKQFRIKLE